ICRGWRKAGRSPATRARPRTISSASWWSCRAQSMRSGQRPSSRIGTIQSRSTVRPAIREARQMTIDPSEAATSLQDIAAVERRTREALFYAGSSAIFITWGALVACGYILAELYPRSARISWLAIVATGCAATAAIIAWRARARGSAVRDWRLIWAMLALAIYGAGWSYLLGPVVPRPMMYAFQPSLFMLGMILAGLWLGALFVNLL